MEPILFYLQRKLREAGPPRWESIAAQTGVKRTALKKLAYADRTNPGLQTVQRLLDYFQAIERGERQLPDPQPRTAAA